MEEKIFVYISCWANLGGAPGIGICSFDKKTGKLELLDVVRKDLSCGQSFMDQQRGILYVCIETENHPNFRKGGGGRIIAFRPDPHTGALTQIDEIATYCPNTTYLTEDPTGKYLLVANHSAYNTATKVVRGDDGTYHCEIVYDDSTVELFSLSEDGSFGNLLDVAYHYGESPKTFNPHPHCVVRSPSGNFYVVCDKGNDKIYTYRINKEENKLVSCCEPFQDAAGSKPRYCCFHPSLPYLYVNHEGMRMIGVFRYDESGQLESLGTVDIAPNDIEYPEGKGSSGILIHPSGEYLYDMLPAKAAVSMFKIDQTTGIPKLAQYYCRDEIKLRAFAFSPDARFLITTCMQSGTVEVHSVAADGQLAPTGYTQTMAGAAYVTFFEPKV